MHMEGPQWSKYSVDICACWIIISKIAYGAIFLGLFHGSMSKSYFSEIVCSESEGCAVTKPALPIS